MLLSEYVGLLLPKHSMGLVHFPEKNPLNYPVVFGVRPKFCGGCWVHKIGTSSFNISVFSRCRPCGSPANDWNMRANLDMRKLNSCMEPNNNWNNDFEQTSYMMLFVKHAQGSTLDFLVRDAKNKFMATSWLSNVCRGNMSVSKNHSTPKSSNFIGFSIRNHPFWGTPIFGNIHIFQFPNAAGSNMATWNT